MVQKLLIVDDDVIFRRYMKEIIQQNFENIHIIEAQNGAYALQIVKKEKVDIILTDISMPQMTGVELIQNLKDMNWELPIAVLSSYDDFEYVKETLKLGAVDYLLKYDSEDEDICKLISHCTESYDAIVEKKQKIEPSTRLQLGTECKRFYNNMIERQQWENILLRSYVKDFMNQKYYVVCLKNSKYLNLSDMSSEENNLEYQYLYFYHELGNVIYVIWFKEELKEDALVLGGMVNYINSQNRNATIGISDIGYEVKKLKIHVDEAIESCLQSYVHKKTCKWYAQISFEEMDKIIHKINEISILLLQNQGYLQKKNIENKIYELIRTMETGYYYQKQWKKMMRMVFHLFLKKAYADNIGISEEMVKRIEEIVFMGDIERFYDWISEFWRIYDKNLKQENYTEVTMKIIEMITQNIYQNISIEEIAEQLEYSENYIGKKFKNDTGLRIKEYINICKINQAKELLLTNQYKVYEIADKLQFSSDAYFCSVFKSITKMTVKEFMQSVKE